MAYFDRFVTFTTLNDDICKLMQKIKADRMERFGLQSTDALCLAVLSRESDGLSLTALATVCRLDKAAVSRAVHRLCERGAVAYRDAAKSNYRAPLILTQAGEQIVQEMQEYVEHAVRRASDEVAPERLTVMYEVLEQIRQNLADYTREGE